MSEQAFEYNVVRAFLIRQQLQPFLQEKKCLNLRSLSPEDFVNIPPELLVVRREEVVAALEAKHGGFSINTEISDTEIPDTKIAPATAFLQYSSQQQPANER